MRSRPLDNAHCRITNKSWRTVTQGWKKLIASTIGKCSRYTRNLELAMVPDNKPQTSLTDLRAQALCRHQTALAKARTTFDETVAQINEDHRLFHEAYARQWNEVKSD